MPDTPSEHGVRRWNSTVEATIVLRITIYAKAASANGVVGRVRVGDVEVWQHFVAPGQTTPLSSQIQVPVRVGDLVDFALDPHQSDDQSDATDFEAQICL